MGTNNNELIDVEGIVKRGIAISRQSVYKWTYQPGGFPRPMRLGRRLVWRTSEIDEWLESRRVNRKAKHTIEAGT